MGEPSPENQKMKIADEVEKRFSHHEQKGLWDPLQNLDFRCDYVTPKKTALGFRSLLAQNPFWVSDACLGVPLLHPWLKMSRLGPNRDPFRNFFLLPLLSLHAEFRGEHL